MNVLVPIINGSEKEQDFIERLKEDYEKIVLLFVVDQDDDVTAGSVGTRIKMAEETMEAIKKKIRKREVIDLLEWGDWKTKSQNAFKLNECKDILITDRKAAKLFKHIKKANILVYS